MRRRLLTSTLAIALACVVVLGVPLALLARDQVWTSARDRLREQATGVAAGLEDRLDADRPIDVRRYLTALPDRRIVVHPTHGATISAGPSWDGPVFRATVVVGGNRITVEAPSRPVTERARRVSLVVVGLAGLAAVAAVGLALWQTRRLARPVADLVRRADALGRGQFAASVLTSGVPEIDRISEVLERSARQVGALVTLQREFASDAAHQLRTPLTSVGLHLEEITTIGDPAVRDEASAALAQVERLEGVITALLARARGNALEPEFLDLAELVADSATSWQRVLARQDRRLILDLAGPVAVLARRDHLHSVLASLLDNAVSHGRGTVTVTVRAAGDQARLAVHDEGPGVPEHLAAPIFTRRVSGSLGTGIGLALARALATAESGTLELHPDRPAEFTLTLPGHAHAADAPLPG